MRITHLMMELVLRIMMRENERRGVLWCLMRVTERCQALERTESETNRLTIEI